MERKLIYVRHVGVLFKQETYDKLNELSHTKGMNVKIKYGEKMEERPGVSILVRKIVEQYLEEYQKKSS